MQSSRFPAITALLRSSAGFLFLSKTGRRLLLGFLLLLPSLKSAAQMIYVTDAFGNIYLVNLSNCSSTLIVPTNGNTWYDMAVCSGNPNIIYTVDGANNLYMVDVTTGITTLISSAFNTTFVGAYLLNSLVCDGNGTLYAGDAYGSGIYAYDLASGQWTFAGSSGGYGSGGDLTFYNGNLYMAGGTNQLIEMTLSPFGVVSVNPMSASGVFGILTTSTASMCTVGTPMMLAMSGNDVYTVNPTTGSCAMLCPGMVPAATGPIYGAASVYEGIVPPNVVLTANATDTTVCAGQSTTLSANGAGSSGSYLWNPGNLSGSVITVTPAVTTTYSVIGTDTSGCSDTVQVTITVTPGMTVTNTSQMASCFGTCDGVATVNVVTGAGPFTYAWQPNGPNLPSLSGLCAGSYTCIITDSTGGCSNTQTFNITQPLAISLNLVFTNDSCFGQCNGAAGVSASGGTGSTYTYAWSPSGGNAAAATNLCAGNYTVTVTDSLGCTSAAPIGITEPVLLTAVMGGPAALCTGSSVSLSANGSGGTGPYSYNWMPGNITGGSPQVAPQVNSVYTVTITDANGCTATGTQSVTIFPPPVPQFIASDSSGCAPLCVTFTSPPGYTYQWNYGDNNTGSGTNTPQHCYTQPGTYDVSLTITDNNGCAAALTVPNLINVWSSPTADFSYSPDYITIFDPTVYFTDASFGATQWSWTFGDITTSILPNPQHTYVDTGCYDVSLLVTDLNGCTDDTTHEVCVVAEYVFYVPNTFTPNDNGVNDVFFPVILGYELNTYHLMIFDRWGNLIFESNDLAKGWDGKVQGGASGKVCQEDTYVWRVDVRDWSGAQHKYIGHVNLLK